ncbi:hypothetical protein JVT61DRAFT_8266 [Boletus reticuloceps]|uniref:Uncharacterized protein n=1 Tax=Boletus reticuloceps TaxID=495285 RepID=A0A8I2YZW2_9AGAM|nr:hypothetical protein JVT61DRAFT_8266 [Boletus reticuloceps]
MSSSISRTFTVTKPSPEKLRDLTGCDAAVLARRGTWVITSPNAAWVPEPFLDMENLQMRADGRYGYIDPYQWPQLFSHQHSWSVAIPSQSSYPPPSAMSWAWYSPRYADFVLQKDSALGNLNRATLAGLNGLLDVIHARWNSFRRSNLSGDSRLRVEGVHSTLKKIWHVLELSNLSWRDTVVQVGDYQRVFLEVYAIMDFHQLIQPCMLMCTGEAENSPADPRWLGAFTRAPLMTGQLFAAGVPVWLIRDQAEVPQDIIIQDILDVSEPSDIVIQNYLDPVGHFAWPFEVVFRGYAGGEAMHAKIREITYIAKNHGQEFNPSHNQERHQGAHRSPRQGRVGWQPYTKTKRVVPPMQRDAWEVLESVYLTAPISPVFGVFARLKALVDSKKLKMHAEGVIRWRFPDPGMLTAVQNPDTMRRYFGNWLAIRPMWIQHVIAHPSSMPPTSKIWRAFLNSSPADLTSTKATESAKERLRALDEFHAVLPASASGFTWAGDDSVAFRNEAIKLAISISPAQARAITWELCELHFQFDVLAMDQALVPAHWRDNPDAREALWCAVFPLKTIGNTWDAPLPNRESGVLRAMDEEDKFVLLNGLARLLSAWPGAPSHFSSPITPSLGTAKVQGAMSEMLAFYVKIFYLHNGRPPVCPRCLPGS